MPDTLRNYRQGLGQKLAGFFRGTVSVDPDPTDSLGGRSILSVDLYDADRGSKGYANQYAWIGKYKNQRRVRENGYRSLAYAIFSPPDEGTYTLTFYGYGQTDPIDFDATASEIATAVHNANSGLASVTVAADGDRFIATLPDVIDVEIDEGTMHVQGGIGALELNRGLTRALVAGDEFELNGKLPVQDADNVQGMNTIINMALRRMWFIDRFPITPTSNVLGVKSFFGLTGYDWLTSKKQIIALYNPTLWEMVATWSRPFSGTYTLQLDMGIQTYTTDSLAYDASAATVEAALESATGLAFTVSGTTTFTITLERTYYATPILTASTGIVTQTINMLESPSRASKTWSFQYDGEAPYLDNFVIEAGYSFLVQAYRPAHSWICAQTTYGTTGSVWLPSSQGLVDDYDMAIPPLEDVVSVAYAIACHQLAATGPGNETEYWKREAREADRVAAAIKMYDLPFEDAPRGGLGSYGNRGWGSKGFWGRL